MGNIHKDQPIGIFDSGIGGLTVARAIKKMMPNESSSVKRRQAIWVKPEIVHVFHW